MCLCREAPIGEPLRFVENHDVMARLYDLAEAVCSGEAVTFCKKLPWCREMQGIIFAVVVVFRRPCFCWYTNGLNGVVVGGSPRGATTGTAGAVTMVGWCFSLWGIKKTQLFFPSISYRMKGLCFFVYMLCFRVGLN